MKEPARTRRSRRAKAGIRAALRLNELRERRKQTQVGLAEILDTTQANVSRMERSEQPLPRNSRRFRRRARRRLEINAVFEDEVVPLNVLEGEVETPATPTR